jgi:hypothetical protein
MSTLSKLLEAYAVPLQVWLSPKARPLVADTLLGALEKRAQIHTDPIGTNETLQGPAVLVLTAAEIRGPTNQALQALSARAHPGKAILVGGTSDRDTLMAAINDWGVIRVLPNPPSPEALLKAVGDAEAYLKREVALVTAIDDLDIETTMLASAIDHIGDHTEQASLSHQATATTTIASGFSDMLDREQTYLLDAINAVNPSGRALVERTQHCISSLRELVDETHDQAIETAAGLAARPVNIDALILMAKHFIGHATGEPVGGGLQSGASVLIDRLAFIDLLAHMGTHSAFGGLEAIESHKSGEAVVVSVLFKDLVANPNIIAEHSSWARLSQAGATMTDPPENSHAIRLNFSTGADRDD